jgi:hypothetical protein
MPASSSLGWRLQFFQPPLFFFYKHSDINGMVILLRRKPRPSNGFAQSKPCPNERLSLSFNVIFFSSYSSARNLVISSFTETPKNGFFDPREQVQFDIYERPGEAPRQRHTYAYLSLFGYMHHMDKT